VAVHDLAVDVKVRFLVLNENAFLHHFLEILFSFCIDAVVIKICPFRKVDLGFVDVKERDRVVFREFSCLFRIKNVIRISRD
jgi:hypothetical protein